MIIKRISEGIRNQDWLVVIVEVMIVVVGIFIGLQVDDWNEDRKDSLRSQLYLERIMADIETDLNSIENRMQFWAQVSDYGKKGLAYARTQEMGDDDYWDLLLAFFQAGQVAELFVKQSTYDELTSAGELSLISDLNLRGRITDYYNFGAATTVSERPRYREHIRGIIPIDIQSYIWSQCYASDANGDQQMLQCAAPVEDPHSKEIVDTIVANTALMGELRYWMSNMEVSQKIGEARAVFSFNLINAIKAAQNPE